MIIQNAIKESTRIELKHRVFFSWRPFCVIRSPSFIVVIRLRNHFISFVSTLPWTSKFESTPVYNPPLKVRQAAEAVSNLHKTCSSPSIFAMAGDSSWRAMDAVDSDRNIERNSDIYSDRKFDRTSDIFTRQQQHRTPGSDRFYPSEMHLAAAKSDTSRATDNRGSSYYSRDFDNSTNTGQTTTTTTSSFNNKRDFLSGGSKETSPRKETSRSRDSSQSKTLSDYQSFKYQLLNQDRRPSQEENKVFLNPSGKQFIMKYFTYLLEKFSSKLGSLPML
jgi:hypothetical protein